MPSLTRILPALFAITLLNVSIAGCAQKKAVQPDTAQPKAAVTAQPEPVHLKKAQSEGCRTCHAPNGAAGAADFSAIYDNPKSHHPVGGKYPDAAVPNFAQPNGQRDAVAFFDRNANGQPDRDEIMLFGTSGEMTVECASCHKEHGGPAISVKESARLYLRFENTDSALCTTCHQY